MKLEITEEKCWGCKTCEVACKQENQLPDGLELLHIGEDGPRQINGEWLFVFRASRCRHCEEPPCVDACPEWAINRRKDGIVILDQGKCSGCRSCLAACPYDAIAFDETSGVAMKCNLCHHRVDQNLLPACADNICLAHCISLSFTE
jgi:Fe-S-cluster-containing dehydrogenase component